MLKAFRILSLIEGLSLVLLLFVAMPLKYKFGMPQFVPWVGMGHGILFIAYFVMSLSTSHQQSWPIWRWLLVLLASVIPFAFIAVDRSLKSDEQAVSADLAAS